MGTILLSQVHKHPPSCGIYPTHGAKNKTTLNLRLIVGVIVLNAKDAVARRIQALCLERNIAVNALANESGMPPTTIYSMLNVKSQNPGIVSIQKICDGLGISIRQFFDDPLFDNLDPEIK